jgi:hypothetical protein
MPLKNHLDKLLSFTKDKIAALPEALRKGSTCYFLITFQGNPIGAVQSITWESNRLFISRMRLDKEQIGSVFRPDVGLKKGQLAPFDLEIRQEGLPNLVLHDLLIDEAAFHYTTDRWIIGANIYLTLPKKVSLL